MYLMDKIDACSSVEANSDGRPHSCIHTCYTQVMVQVHHVGHFGVQKEQTSSQTKSKSQV